jgi:hypothetical protein
MFIDESALYGKVGAATVLPVIEPDKSAPTLHFCLGPDSKHMAHGAELVGILLGIHLIETEKWVEGGCSNSAASAYAQIMKGVSWERMTGTRRTKASEVKMKTQEERATSTRTGFCLRGCTKEDDRTEYDFTQDDHKALIHAFLGMFTIKKRVEGIAFARRKMWMHTMSLLHIEDQI